MITLEEKKRIIELREKGCSLAHIKKQINRSIPTIRKVLKEYENDNQSDNKKTEKDEEGEEKTKAIQEYMQISSVIDFEHTLHGLKEQINRQLRIEDNPHFVKKLGALREKADWILERIANEMYEDIDDMIKAFLEELNEVAKLKTSDLELKNEHYRLLSQNDNLREILKEKENEIEKLIEKEQKYIETQLKCDEEIKAKKLMLGSIQKEVVTYLEYYKLKKEIERLGKEKEKLFKEIVGVIDFKQLELCKRALEVRIEELMAIKYNKEKSIEEIIPTFIHILPQKHVNLLYDEVYKRQQQDWNDRKRRVCSKFLKGEFLSYEELCVVFK